MGFFGQVFSEKFGAFDLPFQRGLKRQDSALGFVNSAHKTSPMATSALYLDNIKFTLSL